MQFYKERVFKGIEQETYSFYSLAENNHFYTMHQKDYPIVTAATM